MQHVKRALLVLMLVIGVLGVGQPAAAQTIKVWSFGSFTDWLKEIGAAFEKQNPGTKVVVEGYPTTPMHNNLLIAFQTGTGAPNMATIEISRTAMFYKGSKVGFMDLTPMLKASGQLDQIYESRTAPFSFQGKLYGMPFDLSGGCFFYREDVYKAAGINVDSLKTWTDFIAAAQKLKSQGKFALQLGNGAGADAEWGHFWMWLTQAGGGVFDASNNVILDSPVAASVLDFYRDAIKKHGIANTSNYGVSSAPWWAPYRANQVVSDWGPDWYIGFMKRNAPEMAGKWRLAPVPAWKEGSYRASTWGGTMFSIVPTDAATDAASTKFLQFALFNKDNAVSLYPKTGMIAPRKDLVGLPAFAAPDPYFGGQPMGKVIQDLGPQIPPFRMGPLWPEAADLFSRKIILETLTTSKTSQTILKEAADELRKLAK